MDTPIAGRPLVRAVARHPMHAALLAIALAAITAFILAAFVRDASGSADMHVARASACAGADNPEQPASDEAATMLCLINDARVASGLRPLGRSPLLEASAAIKAENIMRCDDFSHTACGQAFSVPFEVAGYLTGSAVEFSENLAYGSGSLASPRSIMQSWLDSADHRRNLFDSRWTEQGVALRRGTLLGGPGTGLWVAHFGTRTAPEITEDRPDAPQPGDIIQGAQAPRSGDATGVAPPRATALRVSVSPARVTSGRRVSYRLVVTARAARGRARVRNAAVTLAGRRARTDARGQAIIVARLRTPGRYKAVAAIERLRAHATVRVTGR